LALTDKKIDIVGAGISGLSAGYHLHQQKARFRVFEAGNRTGGLARSFLWHGISCDLAPHRLYTNNEPLLDELLNLVQCRRIQRKSKILVAGKWIGDPVNVFELISSLPPLKSLQLIVSFAAAKIGHRDKGDSFSSFIRANYGTVLNDVFFKPYAEKLFGILATEISRQWGEKKVRVSTFRDMFQRNNKLYFDHFYYPRKGGYGALAKALARPIAHRIATGHKLEKIDFEPGRKKYICTFRLPNGDIARSESDMVIACLPLPRLLLALGSGLDLAYRPAKLVYLNIARTQVMAEHWAYLVDAHYRVNRISEFKNFSVGINGRNTVICAEVTDTRNFSVAHVIDELTGIDFIRPADVRDAKVVHIDHAYPIFNLDYPSKLAEADRLLKRYPNVHCLGRQARFSHQDTDEIYHAAARLVHRIAGGVS
jgi:protoporphyrinogen oxidase